MKPIDGERIVGPQARTDGILVERVDQDLVIYDEVGKMAHCLSPDVALVWDRCDGRMSQAEISRRLGLAPSIVERAVEELQGSGLLVEQVGYSRREAAKRFAAVGGAALAAPALMYSMPVPAAAAVCSHHVCSSSGTFTDWNAMKGPFPEGMWFNSRINAIAPDTTTVLLVTGTIMLPNLAAGGVTVNIIPMRITFTSGAGPATITYKQDPTLFGGVTFGDEVVPVSCSGGNPGIFLGGVMYQSPNDMAPGATKDWTWSINIDYPAGSSAPTVNWEFGASGYHVSQPGGFTTPTDYNNFHVKPTSFNGAPCDVATSDMGGTPEALVGVNDNGSGSGGSLVGSGSGAQTCTPICA
jgi:DNA-binding Lrp family transcriptional regulator